MMEQRAAHPLDVDLLGYALGDLDAASVAELDQHLGQCLLCRIHLNRIRRGDLDLGPDLVPALAYPEVAPEVLEIIGRRQRPATIEPGQLWLAGSSHRMFLWVEAVNEAAGMATVLAGTLDVDAADHTSLIVEVPRLGREVAIFTSIPGWVPLERLDTFVDVVDVLVDVAKLQASLEQAIDHTIDSQMRVGDRISGPSDERLEFRQILADQLAGLDPESEDDLDGVTPSHSTFDTIVTIMRDELSQDLSSKRYGLCEIKYIDDDDWVDLCVRSLSVRPVAAVHELGCKMLVVASEPSGDGLGFDPEDAYRLLLESGASSLAVANTAEPYLTKMFDRSVLRPAFELPRATERDDPRALWEPLPLTQAVAEFLQGDVFSIEPDAEPLPRSYPELAEFLEAQSFAAIDELRQIRAQKGKNRALKGLGAEDATALNNAIVTSPHLEALLRRIEEITIK